MSISLQQVGGHPVVQPCHIRVPQLSVEHVLEATAVEGRAPGVRLEEVLPDLCTEAGCTLGGQTCSVQCSLYPRLSFVNKTITARHLPLITRFYHNYRSR